MGENKRNIINQKVDCPENTQSEEGGQVLGDLAEAASCVIKRQG